MKTRIAIPAAALLCLSLAACSQAESRDASLPGDRVIGIVQCDDYLARVDACIHGKVPASERAALASEAHQLFTTWKEAAADPQHRATLPQACSITHDVAKDEFAKYGCAL
jgi:uncharacterized lipoprotein YbaY